MNGKFLQTLRTQDMRQDFGAKSCENSLVESQIRKNFLSIQIHPRSGIWNMKRVKYLEFDIKDYIITEILGAGAHGLVIKMKKGNYKKDLIFNDVVMNDVIIKLYSKEDKEASKAFLDEAVNLSKSQKAKQLSLHLKDDDNYRWGHFQNECFQTDKYYGLFIKAGLGSLWDFKNYLNRTNKELNEQELFVFTWSLLDTIYCLHKADLCHRDIKPGNIVINPETFLPELIDYSFASEMSKAQGNPGTPGYRMEDFKLENKELERRDQLISRDYFALGITIINIMFPDCTSLTQKSIKDRLGKLAKFKSIEKKILAETLNTCIFGDTEAKKSILKEYREDYFEKDFWSEEDETEKEKLEFLQRDFNPGILEEYAKKLKSKHYEDFRKYLAEQRNRSENNEESKLVKVTSSLAPQEVQISENFKENPVRVLEERLFYDEEVFMKNNFLKVPEKSLETCCEIIQHLAMIDHKTSDTKLYSTLMVVLFSNGLLDHAVALGENFIHFNGPEIDDGIFLNNLAFLRRQRNLRDSPSSSLDEYKSDSLRLVGKHKDLLIEDLTNMCRSASYNRIKANTWTQERLVLADFEMKLKHQESYIFMNWCFMKATWIDQLIGEEIREKIKKFIYGVNISEREEILVLLQITDNESFLITLLNFCDIFKDFTGEGWLSRLKNESVAITGNDIQKAIVQSFKGEGEGDIWEYLLQKLELVHVMIGFIILYNLKYDLITKFDAQKWVYSEEGKKLREILSNEEFNKYINELQAEQNKKWSRQEFLDSVIEFSKGVAETEKITVPLAFEEDEISDISRLSILGQKLESIFLPSPAQANSHHLLIDFKRNFVSVSAVQLTFRLSKYGIKEMRRFFKKLVVKNVQNLGRLRLEFQDYEKDDSYKSLEDICMRIFVLQLRELNIRMEERMLITDRGFLPILKCISKQKQLNHLRLSFNMCFITSVTIKSLAKALRFHFELRMITLIFKNCSKIESESFLFFWETLKELPELMSVNLYFAACDGVKSLKPKGNKNRLNIKIDLAEILEESWMNDEGWESDLLFPDIEEFDDDLEDGDDNESWKTEEDDDDDKDCEIDENEDWEDADNYD